LANEEDDYNELIRVEDIEKEGALRTSGELTLGVFLPLRIEIKVSMIVLTLFVVLLESLLRSSCIFLLSSSALCFLSSA